MTQKIAGPPKTKRTFTSSWSELDYLCMKVRYWLYVRKSPARAGRYLHRLQRVLHELPNDEMAILRQEGTALLCELKGERGKAIEHRRREIELMEWLHREARLPRYDAATRAYMLQGRGRNVLRERREILESLKNVYAANGRINGRHTR